MAFYSNIKQNFRTAALTEGSEYFFPSLIRKLGQSKTRHQGYTENTAGYKYQCTHDQTHHYPPAVFSDCL
jgi:hypothetical protein